MKQSGYSTGNIETILLVFQGRVFEKSDAVILILSGLGGVWRFARVLAIIPKKLRDMFYLMAARNRYVIGGRRKACEIPLEVDGKKFLP